MTVSARERASGVATGAARRARVPVDPALPGLALLLDSDAMEPFLRRSLPPDAPLTEVRILRARYAPRTKLVVRYDVGLDGRRYDVVAMTTARPYLGARAAKPRNVALARLVEGRSPAESPLRYEPELDALIHWYPLDLELPALAEPPERLAEELLAAGVRVSANGGEPATLAYAPRRRAVLRLGDHVLKLYAEEADFAGATANLVTAAALGGIPTAALEASLPRRLVTVQPLLPGARPHETVAVAREVGELLGQLAERDPPPNAGLAVTGPADQLAVAAGSARFLAALVPGLGGRLAALLRALEAATPSINRVVVSHGDFSARQLLQAADGLAVVDWDALRLAPEALDPATYAAHLVSGRPGDLDGAVEALEAVVEGYARRPAGLSWYFATAILRHARAPFKYFEPDWPERIERMVAAAEAARER